MLLLVCRVLLEPVDKLPHGALAFLCRRFSSTLFLVLDGVFLLISGAFHRLLGFHLCPRSTHEFFSLALRRLRRPLGFLAYISTSPLQQEKKHRANAQGTDSQLHYAEVGSS